MLTKIIRGSFDTAGLYHYSDIASHLADASPRPSIALTSMIAIWNFKLILYVGFGRINSIHLFCMFYSVDTRLVVAFFSSYSSVHCRQDVQSLRHGHTAFQEGTTVLLNLRILVHWQASCSPQKMETLKDSASWLQVPAPCTLPSYIQPTELQLHSSLL